MTTFSCFDKETTSTKPAETAVVQAAVVSAPARDGGIDLRDASLVKYSQLFAARDVPEAATRVHHITDRDPGRFPFPVTVIPGDAPAFADCAASMFEALTEPGIVSVSYNGCKFDIPILARFAAPALGLVADAVELAVFARHIDVMRVWLRAKAASLRSPWSDPWARDGYETNITADMFAGTLTAAHGFWFGEGFDSAHDATVDCLATLRVLDAMLRQGFVDVEKAIAWSNLPLPGDVDFDGKFKWDGDQVLIGFGKHQGDALESVPKSYLRWMLGEDFHRSTKAVIADFLRGEYPQRAYEDEA